MGRAQVFGDIDAYRERDFVFSLRSASKSCSFYEIEARDFVMHLKSHGKEREFKKWQSKKDQEMINKLASNLFNIVKGMNVDGIEDTLH